MLGEVSATCGQPPVLLDLDDDALGANPGRTESLRALSLVALLCLLSGLALYVMQYVAVVAREMRTLNPHVSDMRMCR